MAGQLIPPPGYEPSMPAHATSEQLTHAWLDLCEASEAFLIAGLRAKVGPEGDWRQAYRRWYSQRMEEHDRTVATMLANLSARENGLGH